MKDLYYDVLIVGAGPSGIAAALSASRSGASVCLIERYGCIGGGITSMYIRPFLGNVKNVNIGREIEKSVADMSDRMSSVEAAKCALTRLVHDAGISVFLQSSLASVSVKDRNIEKISVTTQSGIREFKASIYIDATGDGALSAMAGCKIEIGRDGDRLMQPTSLMFTIDNIAPWQDLICQHEEDYTVLSTGEEYLDLCHKACESGELPPTVNIVRLYRTAHKGERMVNATQLNKVDPLEPSNLFESEYQLREQMHSIVSFLRRHVPGYENIRVNGSSSTLGIRESRRVIGDYVLNVDDLLSGRSFDDAIVHGASFCVDIHNPSGPGQSINEEGRPHEVQPYDIPYRCLTPLGFDNLLTAGRCISGTHEAHASYRVMRICMAIGDAAGHAAAISSKRGITTREVHVSDIQKLVNIEA